MNSSARDCLLKRLGVSPLSELRAQDFLQKKGFSNRDSQEAISYAKEQGFIDDFTLAQNLVHGKFSRMHLGARAMIQKLQQLGIPQEIAKDAIDQLEESHNLDAAIASAQKKLHLLGVNPSLDQIDVKIRQKVLAYLASRGFASSDATRALNTLLSS